MKKKSLPLALLGVLLALSLPSLSCQKRVNSLADDAGGRRPEFFAELAEDVFKPMDGGIELTPDEVKGRNTWNLWCAGNEQFWDRMAREGYGLTDFLLMIDSRNRGMRFKELGLINQPGYRQASKPDRYGLWIDEAVEPESQAINPEIYGRPTGIMGFRLFDNPDFKNDGKWDAQRYYTDPDYSADPKLVRPYRVGMSCGSCHIAFDPTRPPADPESPKWENLASAIGNQYIREGRVFAHTVRPGGFFWEMLKAQPPGTSDTSRIATDHINNPNTINAIFALGERLREAGEERLAGDTLRLPGVTASMKVPRVLKDGADSVGVPGATLRVFVNIGAYSQHWLQQHNALIGLTRQRPFSIETAQQHSVYWLATQQKFENIAKFFQRLKSFRLEDAPGGRDFMTKDEGVLNRGKLVFAEHCANCHSSKRPPAGENELAWFRQEALKPDFRDDNFFSDDKRYPVTLIGTNAARACATNAKRGHIWEAFSSETYKGLPAVGEIEVWNPYADRMEKFTIPGGGTGYYRTPSLISLWSSAPLLHNNALGVFNGDPSVKGRVEAYTDAMTKLLWPGKRLGKESVWRTSRESQLQLQLAVVPEPLRSLLKPHADPDGYFRVGPIPEGTPINLLANVGPEMDPKEFVEIVLRVKKALLEIKLKNLDPAASKALLRREVAPALFKASNCPDLIEDRGHLFGADLPDPDKRALIEFLKTL